MSELMEDGLNLIDGEQGREGILRSRHVADIDDDRADVIALGIDVLVPEVGHPCAAPLGVAREVVSHEYAEQAAIGICNLERIDSLVVHRHIRKRLNLHSVDLLCCCEDSVTDILHLEIWLGELLVQGVLALTHLFGIVEPVPWLDRRAFGKLAGSDVLVHDLLHVGNLFHSLAGCRSHDLSEEAVDSLRVAGHLVVELVGCESVESEHAGLLGAEFQDLEAESLVVIFIAIVAA